MACPRKKTWRGLPRWWEAKLQGGMLLPGAAISDWENPVLIEALWQDYLNWAVLNGISPPLTVGHFGRLLNQLAGDGLRVLRPQGGDDGSDAGKSRPRYYQLPSIVACREYFLGAMRYAPRWQALPLLAGDTTDAV